MIERISSVRSLRRINLGGAEGGKLIHLILCYHNIVPSLVDFWLGKLILIHFMNLEYFVCYEGIFKKNLLTGI